MYHLQRIHMLCYSLIPIWIKFTFFPSKLYTHARTHDPTITNFVKRKAVNTFRMR